MFQRNATLSGSSCYCSKSECFVDVPSTFSIPSQTNSSPVFSPQRILSTQSLRAWIVFALCSSSMCYTEWTLPSYIQTTFVPKLFKATSCVTMTKVILFLMFKSTRIFITISEFLVSRSPVGSSRSKISGSFASALAMVTLCCSPPES